MKKLALATFLISLVMICALALWQMREALVVLALGLALSSALSPAVGWLNARGIGRGPASGLVFLALLVVLVGPLLVFGGGVTEDLILAVNALPGWYDSTRLALAEQGSWLRLIILTLPPSSALSNLTAVARLAELGNLLLWLASGLAVVAALGISVAALGFYWLLDQQHIERFWLSLLPLAARSPARAVWGRVYEEVGRYVRAEAVICVCVALLLLLAYRGLQLPGATLLALLGGLAMVVPLLGPPLAVLPGVLVASTQGGQAALLTLLAAGASVVVVRLVVAPRVQREGVSVNPVLALVLIMALAELGGIWLIALGPPLAAAIQAATRAIQSETRTTLAAPTETAALAEALDAIAAEVDLRPEDAPRLYGLLARARNLLAATHAELQ